MYKKLYFFILNLLFPQYVPNVCITYSISIIFIKKLKEIDIILQ